MPTKILSSSLIKFLPCPENRRKIEYFDPSCKGLSIEVRASGGRTYYLRYRDCRGKIRQIKLGDARDLSLADAKQLATKRRREIALGIDPLLKRSEQRQTPTFQEFVEKQYLPHANIFKRAVSTERSILSHHLLPKLGALRLNEISQQLVRSIHEDRITQGAAPASANRMLILLRRIFSLAIKWETAGARINPCTGISPFTENNLIERFLTVEETKRLFDSLSKSGNPVLPHIIAMLIYTGARRREVLTARWSDINVDLRLWRIPETKAGKPRHVPLADGAVSLLSKLPKTSDWVFANPLTGKPFKNVYVSWDRSRRRAGLDDVRIHDLRHSFASFLVNNGRSLYEVQKILGHSQARTTQRYAHLAHGTLIDAANAATLAIGPVMDATLNQMLDVQRIVPTRAASRH
jgi:integrase